MGPPKGLLRSLQSLQVTAAAPSVLGSGLLQLAFLPRLMRLVVALDIPPACPERLRDLPTALQHLSLANTWLEALPSQLNDLTGGLDPAGGLAEAPRSGRRGVLDAAVAVPLPGFAPASTPGPGLAGHPYPCSCTLY